MIAAESKERYLAAFEQSQSNGNGAAPAWLKELRRDGIASDFVTVTEKLDERQYVVAGLQSRWIGRRKIELSELLDEHSILPTPGTVIGELIAEIPFQRP